MAMLRSVYGIVLVHFWFTTGTLLVHYWYTSGTLLAHCWPLSCRSAVLHPYTLTDCLRLMSSTERGWGEWRSAVAAVDR